MGNCNLNCILPFNPGKGKKLFKIGLTSKNDFKLQKVIGIGGYGFVYKAIKTSTKIVYALKVMSKIRIYERSSIDSVMNEKTLLSKINHP